MKLSTIIYNLSYSLSKHSNLVYPSENHFIPNKIYEYIRTNYKHRYIYKFVVNTNKINIHLFTKNKNTNTYTWSIVLGVVKIFLLLNQYNIDNNTINVYYYPTPFKKLYNKELTPNEVNSGYTTFLNGGQIRYITIFREEEFHKVLLHEVIHYTNITSSTYSIIVNKLIMKETPFKNNIHFEEALTDFLAIYYNTLYNELIINNNDIIDELIENEIKYQEELVCYLLNHYNFTNVNEIWENKYTIYQDTAVLSYYILKLGLFYNMNSVLKNPGKTIKDYNELYEISKLGIKKHSNKLKPLNANIGETSMRMTK